MSHTWVIASRIFGVSKYGMHVYYSVGLFRFRASELTYFLIAAAPAPQSCCCCCSTWYAFCEGTLVSEGYMRLSTRCVQIRASRSRPAKEGRFTLCRRLLSVDRQRHHRLIVRGGFSEAVTYSHVALIISR